MAITVEARTSIIELVVGMFGAAPGASVLSDLVASYEKGTTIKQMAASLANTNEFKGIFPTFLTNGEFATKLVDRLVGSEVVASEKALAVTELTAMLNAGKSRSDVFVDAINAVNALTSTNANWGNAGVAFDNKVAVAVYYSVDKQLSGSSLADLQAVVSSVTSSAATVTSAKATADKTASPAKSFTLTTSVDSFTGGDGDDIFTADNTGTTAVTSTADTINGGAGTDTLNIFAKDAATALPAMTSVEALSVYDLYQDLDLTSLAQESLTTIKTVRGDGDFKLSLGKNVSSVSISDMAIKDAGANNGVTIAANASTASLSVNLSNISITDTADEDVTITGAALKTITVNATGTKSTVEDLTVTGATTVNINAEVDFTAGLVNTAASGTINVTGAGKVSLGALDDDVKSFDASNASGAITISSAVDQKDAVIKLGSGADKFTTDDDGFASTDKFSVDGGAGEDTLVIAADADVSTADEGGRYKNFEVLQRAINADLDVSVFGADTTLVKASIGDGGLTNMQAAMAGAITVTADNAGSTFSLKTATGTSDTLTITSKNATSTASADLTTVSIDGFEVLNFSAFSGAAADKTSVTITTADQLKTVNLGGSNFVVIDVANDTAALTKLDASGNSAGTTITVGAQTGALVVTGSEKVDAITLEAVGGAGTQTINAGAGKDTITSTIAIASAATINGGADEDTVSFSNGNATTETLTVGDNSFAKMTSIEVIDFAGAIAGDLTWTIGGFANALATANGGVLKITGDTFALGAAADDITIDASVMSAGNSINVNIKDTDGAAGDASDIAVTGSDGNDTIAVEEATAASANIITVNGGKGNDTVTVKTSDSQDGKIVVDAGDGDDTIDVSAATSDDAGNLITGGKGNDTIKLDTEGAATDFTVVLASSAANNGVDTITNFTQGAGGDVLKPDAFLDATAMNAKLTANPGAASDVENDVNLLVDVAGGQDITTAEGLTTALGSSGEYANINMAASSKAIFVTAANSNADQTQYIFYGSSDAAGNISVTLVGTVVGDIDSWVAANFAI